MDSYKYQYEVLRAFALTHNYNKWIYSKLKPYIGKNTLEVGCGIGNLTEFLAKHKNLTCIDKCKEFIKHMLIDFPEINFYEVDITDQNILKLLGNTFDTIICVNVLEHIKDDLKALKNMFNLLKTSGRLLLLVPALQILYGDMDKELEHFRRYSKNKLIEKLIKVGFTIEKVEYNNFIGTFGWLVNGRIFRRKRFPIVQTIIFDKFIPFISKIEEKFILPFGMNLFVVAKKI